MNSRPSDSTRIEALSGSINSLISSSAKHLKATATVGRRLTRYSPSGGIVIGALLFALVASASLFAGGGSVAAFTESIGTFQPDCATPKTSYNLGDSACAVVTGASSERRIVWVAPDGTTAQVSAFFSGNGTDSFPIPTTGSLAQVGTWSVVSIDGSGLGFAAATFVVRDPNLANADLEVSIFGPSEVSPGGNASYVVEVDNRGPDAAQGVTLTVPVPANVTFVSSDCPGLNGITCTIGSLNAGSSFSATYVFNVSGGAVPGSFITSTASVSSSTNDPFRSNNTATYAAPVVVTNPGCSITCPGNIDVNNDPNAANPCVAVVTYATPTVTGNCADPETGQTPPVVCSPPSGTAFPVGITTVVCSSGGTSCSFTVTVHDTRAQVQPTITCPSDISASETTPGSGFAVVNYPAPTTTGNCVTVVCTPPSGSSFPVGTTTVNCTGTDSSGTSVSCSFKVTVVSGNCSITCPADITVSAAAGQCSAVVTFADPTTSGTCGTVTCTPASGSTFPVGTTPVTCTSSGGPSCTFSVTVVPAAPPTITTCASNKIVSVDANCQAAIPNLVREVVTMGCSVTVTQSPAAGAIVGPGTYTVTITAENEAGSATCTATVSVVDTTPPVITACPAPTSAAADANCQAAVPNVIGGVVASDNCTPAGSLTVTQSPAAGTLVSKGVTTITITVTDASNNSATCTTTFTVNDITPPVITCPANIVVHLPLNSTATSMAVNYTVTATDNCPGVTVVSTPASGSVFPVGTTTVTSTAMDTSNNTSSCSFTVTVLYDFTGFFSPVANPPTFNVVNAGRAIPVKFSLSGNKGLSIFPADSPVSGVIPCDASAPATDLTDTVTAGSSSLTYDPTSDQYIYVWATDAAWAGTCRQLQVTLNDGSVHLANFKFK